MRRFATLLSNTFVLCLALPILGCDGGAARAEADCSATHKLYQKVLAAMCSSWSEDREIALGDLVDAAKDKRFEEEVTGEDVSEWASEIGPAECRKAGYGNLGPKYLTNKQKRHHLIETNVEAKLRSDPSVIAARKRLKPETLSNQTCEVANE